MKPIKLIELFAGIGSQAMALRDLGIPFEYHKVVEIDKYAMKSYNAIHGTNFEVSDITQLNSEDLQIVDTYLLTYLLTYSFPCQDLSLSGKQAGMKKGEGTRSGLLWEVERLLSGLKELPQILLMENVPQIHNKKNISDFEDWCDFLEYLGYVNYYDDLNAKDFGVAQNRNRCFMVSILNGYKPFAFSIKVDTEKTIYDYLEDDVEDKFYLRDRNVKSLIDNLIESYKILNEKEKVRFATDLSIKNTRIIEQSNVIKARYDNGISNFQHLGTGVIEIKKQKVGILAKQYGTDFSSAVDIFNTICQRDGKGLGKQQGNAVLEIKKIFNSKYNKNIIKNDLFLKNIITDGNLDSGFPIDSYTFAYTVSEFIYYVRLRKLTPKECWRLMGFSDEDFEKAEKVNSNSQLYKQAGNSIVKNVLMAIFYELFKNEIEMNPCLNCKWKCEEEKCNEYFLIQKLKNPCYNCGFDCDPEDKEQCKEYKKWIKVNTG